LIFIILGWFLPSRERLKDMEIYFFYGWRYISNKNGRRLLIKAKNAWKYKKYPLAAASLKASFRTMLEDWRNKQPPAIRTLDLEPLVSENHLRVKSINNYLKFRNMIWYAHENSQEDFKSVFQKYPKDDMLSKDLKMCIDFIIEVAFLFQISKLSFFTFLKSFWQN
jgi:hypothetical protein